MAGWSTMDPTTRAALVADLLAMYPYYKVRDFNPEDVLDPIIIDTRTGKYVDLAGNVLRENGTSPLVPMLGANELKITIDKKPFPLWLLLFGLAGLLMLKKGKLL